VERLVGGDKKLINFIYKKPEVVELLKDIYSHITKWEQSYNPMGDASIKILFDAEGQSYGGGFEMSVANPQIYRGRMWIIRFIY